MPAEVVPGGDILIHADDFTNEALRTKSRRSVGGSRGCADLAAAVERAKPRIHVFGHVHESYGEATLPSGVRCYNAALCEGDGTWHGRTPFVVTA